jgi:hypothetical protein
LLAISSLLPTLGQEAAMFGRRYGAKPHPALAAKTEPAPRNRHEPAAASTTLLTIVGAQK